MQNNNYRNTWAVSQSALKDFRFKSPKRWKDIWIDRQVDLDKDEEAFVFGSLVDTILFTPKEINERFYVADVAKIPTGTVEKIVSHIYNNSSDEDRKGKIIEIDLPDFPEPIQKLEFNLEKMRDKILEACDKLEWNSTWKPDTRINKIIEKGTEYFRLLAAAKGKKVISSETNLEALGVVAKLKTDPSTKKYFVNDDQYKNYFQVELFDTYKSNEHYEVPIKCAIDIVHLDKNNRTITIVDFKTSHSAHNFIESIKRYGYCDQLSFYTFMLRKWVADKFQDLFGIEDAKDWRILEPLNVVIDENEKTPYIYKYDWKDITLSQDGNASFLFNIFETDDHNQRIKKGWMQILNEICWHIQNNKWDYPVEIYKTGSIRVNLVNS